jgi:hypothetical protein
MRRTRDLDGDDLQFSMAIMKPEIYKNIFETILNHAKDVTP